MEYNKRLYTTVDSIYKRIEEFKQELEDCTDINKIKNLNKQIKDNQDVCDLFLTYKQDIDFADQCEKIIATEKDPDLIKTAQDELAEIKSKIGTKEEQIKIMLLPKDENDSKNVIVEMRPAAGGDESSIFVSDLFDCYQKYVESQGWKIQILNITQSSLGIDFIAFKIMGKDVYSKMKFESGVHRVQRVPLTESKGRVHTSTITVAVLPEVDDIQVVINPSDLRVDTYRSGGAGGQHVNRTDSAVRLTHLPTGIVVACQEGRSQIENRETAMQMLRAKLWEKYKNEQHEAISNMRKNQVGSGERAEKIRTYNYPQNRVTDHRINLTLNKLDQIMLGHLDEIISALVANDQLEKLKELEL